MENRIFISPKQDVMFKKAFCSTDSKHILKSLLSSITSIPKDSFNELTVENPNLNPNRKEGNKSIVDVSVGFWTRLFKNPTSRYNFELP